MTKAEALMEIEETQQYYVNELHEALLDPAQEPFKEIFFTSDTGTGKTKMVSMLCNKMPDVFFIITTLSRGQLHFQIRNSLKKDIHQDNYVVYGACDFTANTKRQAEDIVGQLPQNKKIIWVRDEGHINTNRWQEIVREKCWKIINVSATNREEGIRCNFNHTMMLRTVCQQEGTPEEALDKLLEIKKQHKKIKQYNPCAIMRCLDEEITKRIIDACQKRQLKYINITEESFDMSELCADDNEYDVIINKFKIVEGIDLRRAHVVYMTNEPSNPSTTIQVIGRCRRNALLYRDDVDIFADKKLLQHTRKCFVYYNVQNMKIKEDENGNLCLSFCDEISCERLKPGTVISVENGIMPNGLTIIELNGKSGQYTVVKDTNTGFNIVQPETDFYQKEEKRAHGCIYRHRYKSEVGTQYRIDDIYNCLTLTELPSNYFGKSNLQETDTILGYDLFESEPDIRISLSKEQVNSFISFMSKKRVPFCQQTIKQNKRFITLHYDIGHKISEGPWFYLEENNKVLNLDAEDLNEQLFNLFYSQDMMKEHVSFASMDKIHEFIQENCNQEYKLPKGMEPNASFEIVYRHYPRIKGVGIQSYNSSADNYVSAAELCQHGIDRRYVSLEEVEELADFYPYKKITNDMESAIIGTDIMQPVKTKKGITWIEDSTVTSKIDKYCKLSLFLSARYKKQIDSAKDELYVTHRPSTFDKKCNSCLGFCAEYYGKYLIYGDRFLRFFIDAAKKEAKTNTASEKVIVRACMLKYKEMMRQAYGEGSANIIHTISMDALIQNKYDDFIDAVIRFGTSIARFISKEFDIKEPISANEKMYDPNLSVRHITALADFISKDKIVDVKCTGSITLKHIKQVLAYHYLSTKRDDLAIKEVIVYDAIADRCVRVQV